MSLKSRIFATPPRVLVPVGVFLLINAAFLVAGKIWGSPRGYFADVDYALALIVAIVLRRYGARPAFAAGFACLALAGLLDAYSIVAQAYFHDAVQVTDFLSTIDLWPWPVIGPLLGGIALGAAIFALPTAIVRTGGARTLLGVILVLFLAQLALGPITGPLVGSGALRSATLEGQVIGQGITITPSHDAVMARRLARAPPAKVLSVSAEALGQYRDPAAQAALLEALTAPLTGRYTVTYVAGHRFTGLTLQGEIRELCGLILSRPARAAGELPALWNCLPRTLDRAGYATVAYHGNNGRFYQRQLFYPFMGFQREVFLDKMAGLPRCRPDLFNGACDAGVFGRALTEFSPGRRTFVHVVTLDAHLPLSARTFPKCAGIAEPARTLCAYEQAQRRMLGDLGHAVATARTPPDLIVLFGDHAPPFANGAKAAITPGVAPYIELRRVAP